jgi:hypothetical protein
MNEASVLLLARADDPIVATLRALLRDRLLHASVADLSGAGWRHVVGHPELATAGVRGKAYEIDRIAAVLCRIRTVVPEDLEHIDREDRAFAAVEMHAFLRAWLAHAGKRCMNEPSSTSLAGPDWHPLRWRWLAARCGIPAAPLTFAGETAERVTATVMGDRVVGTADDELVGYSLRIAQTVQSRLLAVQFVSHEGWRLDSANSLPLLDARGATQFADWALAA